MSASYDVVIVGAGIVGLAHAWSASQRGLRVAVIERDHRCVGASIRNFGFITVTGQAEGDTWRRAMTSRDVWARVAPDAGIAIEHRGLWVLARHPQAVHVLQAFMRTPMAHSNELVDADEAATQAPALRTHNALAAMWSPHEMRVESRAAIPKLTAWLAQRHNVAFHMGEAVLEVDDGRVRTAHRSFRAGRVVICPGSELTGVGSHALAHHRLELTRLQMLRVRPPDGFRLGSGVMGDLSLVRYAGYAALPEAAALRAHLHVHEPETLAAGIHLIVVQSADGTLVVGDSHHRFATPEPFADERVDALILRHLREHVKLDRFDIVERWTGVYPTGIADDCLIEAPDASTRVVVVTSGTGASTAFGIAEEVFDAWT